MRRRRRKEGWWWAEERGNKTTGGSLPRAHPRQAPTAAPCVFSAPGCFSPPPPPPSRTFIHTTRLVSGGPWVILAFERKHPGSGSRRTCRTVCFAGSVAPKEALESDDGHCSLRCNPTYLEAGGDGVKEKEWSEWSECSVLCVE